MKNTIFRYGLYGGIFICVLFLATWYLMPEMDFNAQEIAGYASMILALIFVFFGIRHYRDQVNSGTLSLASGIKIGLGISLITALCFGLLDLAYILWLEPDFMENYYQAMLQEMQATLPAEEFEVRKAAMESEKELFSNPLISFALMAFTVFLIGIVITLISALILKRKASDEI